MTTNTDTNPREGALARLGLAFANWSTRWFPDPLVFAFVAVIVVFILAVLSGASPAMVVKEGGKSFWSLATFTMQMAMVVIGGYVVATAKPVQRAIEALSRIPKGPRTAIAFVALFAMITALLSWGLSLILSGRLVRVLARRLPALDYRAAGAAGYLGLGVTCAIGLSSSAALLMATSSALPPALAKISGVIPLTNTIFAWQNGVLTVVLTIVATAVAYISAPGAASAMTADDLGIDLTEEVTQTPAPKTPGERLENSPVLTLLVAAILVVYLIGTFVTSPLGPLTALDLNNYNLIFLTIGLLLHWRPANFLLAVKAGVPATAGVLIQFPFFAMIFGMIANTGLSDDISRLFIHISNPQFYPLLVAAYSSTLGIFIPSGGSKWLIEAPYVLSAARATGLNLGWTVQIYNAAEALPNLINPFFMLPLLGILKCQARDLVGYSILQLIVLLPVCYALCYALASSFR